MIRLILVSFLMFITLEFNEDTVLLIPHTHDDLGWLYTIEQYYNKKVRSIFDTTLTSLEINDSKNKRKFVYSEIGFLKLYLNENNKKSKIERIKKQIELNKWEFVNGGMSQSDSGCPHYEDIIENYFYGLNYLKRNFAVNSSTGWQLDPFGHSKTLSYIVRLMGMKDIVINRIGDFKKGLLGSKKQLTFNQRLMDDSSIWVHVTSHHYSSPEGMSCDGDCDFGNFDKTVLDKFLKENNHQYTFNPWYFYGDDFYFSNAENNYRFSDQVLALYDNFEYAVFSDYLKLIDEFQQPRILVDFDQDFLVYDTKEGSSWSGYYTTKPQMKLKIRRLGVLLRTFKHIIVMRNQSWFDLLEIYFDISETFGVFLHHDCITGTSKEIVDKDYYKMMKVVQNQIIDQINLSLNTTLLFCYDYDDYLNISSCQFKNNEEQIYVNVYNQSQNYQNKKIVDFVYFKNYKIDSQDSIVINCFKNKCLYRFADYLNPFGFKQYKLVKSEQQFGQILQDDGEGQKRFTNFDYWIENQRILLLKKENQKVFNEISLLEIESFKSNQYVIDYDNKPKMEIISLETCKQNLIKGQTYEKLLLNCNNFDIIIIQDKSKKDQFEIFVQFNKIDIFQKGIDLVLKIKNPEIQNNNKFYTDSNGFFEIERTLNNVFENSIYPISSYVKIIDSSSENILAVFTESSQGVISPQNGTLLIYMQRSSISISEKLEGTGEILRVTDPFIFSNTIVNSECESTFKQNYYNIIENNDNKAQVFYSLSNQNNIEQMEQINKFDFPENLRINVDFVNKEQFIVRFQNINRSESLILDTKKVIKALYGDLQYERTSFEVFFGYKNKVERKNNNLEIFPLHFEIFLISLK